MVLEVTKAKQLEVIFSQYLILCDVWEDLNKFLYHRITLRSRGEF